MAEQFKPLDLMFSGREDCLGLYHLSGAPEAGKKWQGKAISYPNSKYPDRVLTPQDYELHYEGKIALGVVPVFMDGTCKWFAIDIDDYTVDHTALSKKISIKNIPLVHCRSKSGGAHLYCIIDAPIKASDAVALARKWIKELGFDPTKTEVFPKQTKFDSPDAKGNWIIIPYFGGDKALDYAIDDKGKKVEFEDFLQYCQARVITPKEFSQFLNGKESKNWSQDEILEQSPPCVIAMMENNIKEGDGRNNAASHLSWYFRKLDEFFETSEWKDRLNDFNQSYFDPPLSYAELSQVIKNHSGGKYKARCEQNPMANLCNRDLCLTCKFGIKEISDVFTDFKITALTKIDLGLNPLWKPAINGQEVVMDTKTFTTSRLFRNAVLAKLNILIPLLKQNQHDEIIGAALKNVFVIESADLVSEYGKIESCFKQWISHTIEKSKSMDKLLDGLPYYDDGTIWFRLHDFVLEYRRVYKENVDDKEIYAIMQSVGYKNRSVKLDGIIINAMVWPIDETDAWFTVSNKEKF